MPCSETHTTTPLTITTKSTIPIWCLLSTQQIGTTIFIESMIRCNNKSRIVLLLLFLPLTYNHLTFLTFSAYPDALIPLVSKIHPSSSQTPSQKPQIFRALWSPSETSPSAVDTPQGTVSFVLYDPIFHLNLPSQSPLFRELLQSLPYGYTLPGSGNGSLFSSGNDKRKRSERGVMYDLDTEESLGR
ncbi:hypothetical protein ACFX2F_032516 [Malus domestica]